MADETGRSTTTVALLIVGLLVGLWLLRFVIGVFVRLAQIGLVAALVILGAYALYRFWQGWTAAGDDITQAGQR